MLSTGDRPATRTRGPVPDEQNAWQKPPPDKRQARVGAAQSHFKRLGVEDRDVRLGYVHTLTGHAVTSMNDLTDSELADLLTQLSKLKNDGELKAALDRADQAGKEAAT